MRAKSDYLNSDMGEDMVTDRLIVIDDVSGLADKSDNFANFLTVSKKLWFFLPVCFSHYLSDQTKLGNDNGSNSHI